MKQIVYEKEIKNRVELLERIRSAGDIIRQSPSILDRTWTSLRRRTEKCIEVNGGNVEQLM